MKNSYNKIKNLIINHKKISVILLIVLIILGYWIYKKTQDTSKEIRYVTAQVSKETIISNITGSGQVSASNEINIQPEVSGTIISVNTRPGNYVNNGDILFKIDDTEAQKDIRDAEISLENARLSLEKLKIQNSNENLNSDLTKAYDDGFNSVSNTFLDLPIIINGLNDMFFRSSINGNQTNIDWYEGNVSNSTKQSDRDTASVYKNNLIKSYNEARATYDKTLSNYKNISRTSNKEEIENIIFETYETTKIIADTVKISNNYIDFIIDSMTSNNLPTPAIMTTHKSNLSSYTSKANTNLSSLLSATTSIKNYKDAFINSDIDIQSSSLSLKQKENTLIDTKENLKKYIVVAPFSGIIASVPVNVRDNVGSGTTLATIITTKKIATISLNEVDIAKIKLGQKTTLTFDAIPNLTITGKVVEIDSMGTVSQGVVTYNVKISFDTNETQVKPGMTVNASIIIGIKQNVLAIPNSAVKTKGNMSYVETFSSPLPTPENGIQGSTSTIPPTQNTIETGASNDTSTEIISGLKEGDTIVIKTITNTTKTSSTPSILNTATGNRGQGGIRP